jgi:hypothetical protein
MQGNLPAQPQQLFSSQHSQYHTQANAFPYQQEWSDNWTKVLYKRVWSAQDENETKTKHSTECKYWLNQTSTSNRYTALLEEVSEDQQHKTGPENMPKPTPIYITGFINISPLI